MRRSQSETGIHQGFDGTENQVILKKGSVDLSYCGGPLLQVNGDDAHRRARRTSQVENNKTSAMGAAT